jgi:predicted small secreted protein
MKNLIARMILCLSVAILTAPLVGCKHTAHGAGEDIEEMGEKIQDKTK